jgi:hypothetical protein
MNPLAVPSSGLWNIGGSPVPPGNASLVAPAPAPAPVAPPPTVGIVPGAFPQLLNGGLALLQGGAQAALGAGEALAVGGAQAAQGLLSAFGQGFQTAKVVLFGP